MENSDLLSCIREKFNMFIRRLGGTIIFILILSCAIQNTVWTGQENEFVVIGKRVEFHSDVLNETRTLEIYLPDDFENSDAKYPVLVVLDGGWFFRYCVSIIDMISPNYLPRMIVIGLPNTDRRRDLDPINKELASPESGTKNFLLFLRNELIPHIEKKYRARNYRILTGHSLAGFFTIYSFLKEPDLFSAFIATSPSIRDQENLGLVKKMLENSRPDSFAKRYLYMSGGGEEPEALHESIREIDRILKGKNVKDFKWSFGIFEQEGHVPIKGFYQGIRNVFPDWIPKLDFFMNGTLEDIKNHYGALSKKYGFRVLPPSPIINSVGQRFLRDRQTKEGIELYAYYVSLYPRSPSGYLYLGEAYIQADNINKARKNIGKALELDPENQRAKKLLEDLKKR
jgi:predicted alpha/beta superfamily hydrolase